MDEMEEVEEMCQVIHGVSLEIQLDPLVSSVSTCPCTVVRSLWLEGVTTLALLGPPLWQKSVFFVGRTGYG